jgi:hypothetical protein
VRRSPPRSTMPPLPGARPSRSDLRRAARAGGRRGDAGAIQRRAGICLDPAARTVGTGSRKR